MKFKRVYVFSTLFIFFTSCEGKYKTSPSPESAKPATSGQVSTHNPGGPDAPTRYEYSDAAGKKLVTQNSFPKGGLLYNDPGGKEYRCVVFWTMIHNETDQVVDFSIDFSGGFYELPSSMGAITVTGQYKLILPPDTMTIEKVAQVNYGLTDLAAIIKSRINNSSVITRTIYPGQSNGIYVVRLFAKPESGWENPTTDGNGTTRAGLVLKGQYLFYNINGKEIPCGMINRKDLALTK